MIGTTDYLLPEMKASGIWHVDSHGRVWSRRKPGNHKDKFYSDRWVRCEQNVKDGRTKMVCWKRQQVFTSRFVWYWFNGTIPEGHAIDHIDENTSNNHPDNLRPLPQIENNKRSQWKIRAWYHSPEGRSYLESRSEQRRLKRMEMSCGI